MSNKYSSSADLTLLVSHSRCAALLHTSLGLLAVLGLLALAARGNELQAGLGVGPVALLWWTTRRQPLSGWHVCWHRGHWFLRAGRRVEAVTLGVATVCLPWVIQLDLVNLHGKHRRVHLFNDSAQPSALAQLRRRLTMER